MYFRVLLAGLLLPLPLLSQSKAAPAAPEAPVYTAPPAPYAPPAVGTKFTYTRMSNTITKVDGWKTWFTDHRGQLGLRHALFVTDNPDRPLVVTDTAFRRLWPLRVGNITDVVTRRGDNAWLWRFTVVGIETVTVAAGKFATYRVDGVEQTLATRNPNTAVTNVLSWWYAPTIGAAVKVNYLQAMGARPGTLIKNELVLIEKPKVRKDGR